MAKAPSERPPVYQIRLKGHLSSEWAEWFEGLTISQQPNGDTLLTGPLVDQAALYGVLKKIRDLALPLLSLNPVPPNEPDELYFNKATDV